MSLHTQCLPETIDRNATYIGYAKAGSGLLAVTSIAVVDVGGDRSLGTSRKVIGWPTPLMRDLIGSDHRWCGLIGCSEDGTPVLAGGAE